MSTKEQTSWAPSAFFWSECVIFRNALKMKEFNYIHQFIAVISVILCQSSLLICRGLNSFCVTLSSTGCCSLFSHSTSVHREVHVAPVFWNLVNKAHSSLPSVLHSSDSCFSHSWSIMQYALFRFDGGLIAPLQCVDFQSTTWRRELNEIIKRVLST